MRRAGTLPLPVRLTALLLLSLLAVLLLPAPPARAADPPPLDVAAAQAALRTQQVHRAPGAVAVFDEQAVLPALPPEVRLLLAPPRRLDDEGSDYRAVEEPLARFAREQDLEVVLVQGLKVRVVGGGTALPDDLPTIRTVLAHRDVTGLLQFALAVIADPDHDDGGRRDSLTSVPATPGLIAQVASGLTGSRSWVAPGVDADLPTVDAWAARVPGLPLRVAVLPVLARGAPYPDLLTPLRKRFPGELVVLVRGSWLEAAGPEQPQVDSARNYLLGRFQAPLSERAVPPANIVGLFLERVGQLRSGVAFSRPQVQPVSVQELLRTWAPRVALALAVLAGGGSLVYASLAGRRRERAAQEAYRRGIGQVLASAARLDVDLLRAPSGSRLVGQAAERHAAALDLLEQAQRSGDPEVLAAASDAVESARSLLAQVPA